MLLSKPYKISLIFVLFVALSYFAVENILGPGVRDYSIEIVKGYSYSDAGHYEKTIIYTDSNGSSKIVVDARVDDYRVEDSKIYIARRPREIYEENGVTNSRLSAQCEYWEINTNNSKIRQIDPVDSLRCK